MAKLLAENLVARLEDLMDFQKADSKVMKMAALKGYMLV